MAMQTMIMHQGAATARLESQTATGSRPELTSLETFPFTVGRIDSCSLPIDSHRVSREHAVIEQSGERFVVRDLASTNGTFVNGQRIETAELNDGDLLVFGDTEFGFHCSVESPRDAATQLLNAPVHSSNDSTTGWELIREVRRIHEQTTLSACRISFEEIVELHSGATYGYQAVHEDSSEASPAIRRLLQSTECRLLARLNQLARAVAVQDARELPGTAHLFLPIESFELGLDDLPASLEQLCRATTPEKELVVEISASAACDIPYFREFLRSIRELGIAIAYDGYAGGHRQIQQFRDIAPDYLRLGRSTTDRISRNANRQRELLAIAKAAADIECDLIAVDLQGSGEMDVCRDLGCRFAQGVTTTGPAIGRRPIKPAN